MEIRTIQPFLQYFGNVRERTMRVARCIPPDKLDWTYAPGKFTLGDLLRHIAVAERFMWAETLQGCASRYTTHGKELADGYENVITFMERMHAESMEIFAKLSDEDLQRKCQTPDEAAITTWKWLRLDGRTRNPSSRTNLSLPWDARRTYSADVWADVGAGSRTKYRRISCCRCGLTVHRKRAPTQDLEAAGAVPSCHRAGPPRRDRASRATGSVRWRV
jgi:uncharacterized damage-inducible protein DinB